MQALEKEERSPMKATARVHIEKMVQYAVPAVGGALQVKSVVYMHVQVDGLPPRALQVETDHSISLDGSVTAPVFEKPRHYYGPWHDALCKAKISAYVLGGDANRHNWFVGLGGKLWPNRLHCSDVYFEFEFDDREAIY